MMEQGTKVLGRGIVLGLRKGEPGLIVRMNDGSKLEIAFDSEALADSIGRRFGGGVEIEVRESGGKRWLARVGA